jgi:RNA polymerase sigma factor (TIGR02999 family)
MSSSHDEPSAHAPSRKVEAPEDESPAAAEPGADAPQDGAAALPHVGVLLHRMATRRLRADGALVHTSEMGGRGEAGAGEVPQADITILLRRAGLGDAAAEAELFRLVYDELHRQAAAWMRRQPRGHTLQATALVHETYLKVARRDVAWNGRGHFFAVAARAMRSILVDHARGKRRAKRGAGRTRVPLDAVLVAFEDRALDILALDEAICELAEFDPQAARVVELKFFGGLTAQEVAEQIGVATRTVERDWETARAWLAERLAP